MSNKRVLTVRFDPTDYADLSDVSALTGESLEQIARRAIFDRVKREFSSCVAGVCEHRACVMERRNAEQRAKSIGLMLVS